MKRKSSILLILAVVMIGVVLLSSGCSLGNPFKGVWWDETGARYEFFSDGTVTETGLIPMTGTYKILDSTRVKLDMEGLWGLAGTQILEYQFAKGELYLTTSIGLKIHLSKTEP